MKEIMQFSIIEKIKIQAQELKVPIIFDDMRALLEQTAAQLDALCVNVLEIGTAVGYSGACILEANVAVNLVTIEKNANLAEFAKNNLAYYGSRVKVCCEDAAEFLKREAAKPELNGFFHLIFLDGPKGQYKNYLPALIDLLSPGGTLIADNVYFHGMAVNPEAIPHKNRAMARNIKEFTDNAISHPLLKAKVLSIADGVLIAKKMKGEF